MTKVFIYITGYSRLSLLAVILTVTPPRRIFQSSAIGKQNLPGPKFSFHRAAVYSVSNSHFLFSALIYCLPSYRRREVKLGGVLFDTHNSVRPQVFSF